jgi:undecaprenyl-diphosphatase
MTASTPRWFLVALLVACLLAGVALLASGRNATAFGTINAALAGLGDPVLSGFTILGQGQVAVAVLAPALWRAPRVLAAALYATPIGLLLTHLPKRVFAEPRPGAVLPVDSFNHVGTLLTAHNAMPSGHTITAFTVAAVLACAAPRAATPRGAVLSALAFGVATLVGLSRIGVGAHWPADVLVGAALGIAAGLAGAAIAARWPVLEGRSGQLAMIVGAAAGVAALWPMSLGYPAAEPLQHAAVVFGLGCCAYALWHWWRAAPTAAPDAAR